jgi:hypothetical protein
MRKGGVGLCAKGEAYPAEGARPYIRRGDREQFTGSIREKPDRGLAPCQAFLAYSL